MSGRDLPIGVFDSGIGGLTVMHALMDRLPHESMVYFGNTARVPYGPKSPATVVRFSFENVELLTRRGIKAVVVACNTATAHALPALRERFDLPIVGVVGPGARAAAQATRSGRVGVIGTYGTIGSGAYEKALRAIRPDLDVVSRACPLFVPLAEEGMTDHPAARLVAAEYLAPLREQRVDTLILGCTHYPLLRGVIAGVMGPDVALVDSAAPTAEDLKRRLAEGGFERDDAPPSYDLYVTDAPQRVETVARLFFGEELPGRLQKVTL